MILPKKTALFRLGDQKLLELAEMLEECWVDTVKQVGSMKAGDIDGDFVITPLGLRALFGRVLEIYGMFLGRLDQVRALLDEKEL